MDLYFDPFNSPYRSKVVKYTLMAAALVLVVVFVVTIFSNRPHAALQRPAISQYPTTAK